ncbi:hypothetical protein [Romboutsia sp.]|uniref:hypothetical protein n=1 Tax=Romboutsia sp. TaxID=1965302 RepID=UPI002CB1136F|nr:hypothetical protein [Romboutsia sp.]HSQ88420.1 hypothetical protein [Romboutsia sp.]
MKLKLLETLDVQLKINRITKEEYSQLKDKIIIFEEIKTQTELQLAISELKDEIEKNKPEEDNETEWTDENTLEPEGEEWGVSDRKFKVLCSIDESIRHDKDINYGLYLVLKSLTEYDEIQANGIKVGYDTINMNLYTLEDLGKMVKGARGNMSADTVGKQLRLMEDRGIIIVEKIGRKYNQILIKKNVQGEKGLMLNNKLIQILSSVLKNDALKVYIYLLNLQEQRKLNNYTNDFVLTAETIFKGSFGREPKTTSDTDLKKVYAIMKGLDSIHLVDKVTQRRTNKDGSISQRYKINNIKPPREPK